MFELHFFSRKGEIQARDYNQWQKLWEKVLFGQFCVSLPFPLLTMLRNNEQNLRQAMLSVRNIV